MPNKEGAEKIRARIHELSEKIVHNPVLNAIEKVKLTKEQWKTFAKQRYLVAIHFEDLLAAGISKANEENMPAIVEALDENLRDEKGLSASGTPLAIGSHGSWRKDFYIALGISSNDLDNEEPIDTTKKYDTALKSLIQNSSACAIAGAVLLQEYSIPGEFEIIKKGRDSTFPEQFVKDKNDTEEIRKQKFDARRYIDFHIVHDAGHHYPDLENAVLQYADNQKNIEEFLNGIEIIGSARREFYNGLAKLLLSK